MRRNSVRKSIALGMVVMSLLALNPIGASAEWRQDSNGWWNTEGSSWSVGWRQINGKWYYFDYNGYMVHDTIIDGYKIGSDGSRIEKIYQAGEKWVVDGQWEFTINSVETTTERNKFWYKNPAQVVIINYSYKNLGYTNQYIDLYFGNFTVIDEKGVVADLYPAKAISYSKQTPIGETCDEAQIAYGLSNNSYEITIQIQQYISSRNKYEKAIFKVPVKQS